jgi:hypothetical protein
MTDKRLIGLEASVRHRGFGFCISDQCNYCDLERFHKLFGPNERLLPADDGGVDVIVGGRYYMWFSEIPTRCTCKL